MPERIALLTDFGAAGPYTGQVRLLLQALAPGVPTIDLMADLPRFRPDLAAYLLPKLIREMPCDTLYLCVVDPGVGGERQALALHAGGNWFVGPDNGLLALAAREHSGAQWWQIDWRPEGMSESFHGRDLFAPVAARIAGGEDVPGRRVSGTGVAGVDWPTQTSRVVYRDVYGNLYTGLDADRLDRSRRVIAGNRDLGFARTFSCVPPGEAFWYRNAFGLVELAVNCGRADEVLGLREGDTVSLN
jgi:S-adenosylmethionine hydrolase